MAIQQDNVNVNEEALEHLSSFSGPTPGQSLTNSPDNPQPYERPPTYTTLEEASYTIFEMLTEDEMFTNIIIAISDGVPITAITQAFLIDGFQKGAWNPDLLLQLVEPTMYMIMSMAEKAGIKYRIDEEDDIDAEEATPEERMEGLSTLMGEAQRKITNTNGGSVSAEIKERIKDVPLPASLLGRVDIDNRADMPDRATPTNDKSSLLEQRG
jgi:hypothetical protein|tara:strand:+ start:7316 stop:7951 length:636 start_codon:yes stop_codon:yes gene_type:complete